MYCMKCGREIAAGGVCVCGAYPPAASGGGTYTADGNAPPSFNSMPLREPQRVWEPPAVLVLRRECGSALSLAVCILYSISLLLSLVGNFASGTELTPGVVLGYGIGACGGGLFCLGLWLFYGACKKAAPGSLRPTGLTLCITGMSITQAPLALAFVGFGLYFLTQPNFLSYLAPYIIAAGVVLCLLFVFALRAAASLKAVVRTGYYNRKVSMILIVVLFIEAAGGVYLVLLGKGHYIELPSALLSGAFMLLMGLLLTRLRRGFAFA